MTLSRRQLFGINRAQGHRKHDYADMHYIHLETSNQMTQQHSYVSAHSGAIAKQSIRKDGQLTVFGIILMICVMA